jgi:hypothetical protein
VNFKATVDNVIIKVPKKVVVDPLAVTTGEEDPILLGQVVACGPEVESYINTLKTKEHQVCVYKARVAILPWQTDTEEFYVVKEENIYGILEV